MFECMDHCHLQDLADMVAPFIARRNPKFHDAISMKESLALTLRLLATTKYALALTVQSSLTQLYLFLSQPGGALSLKAGRYLRVVIAANFPPVLIRLSIGQ